MDFGKFPDSADFRCWKVNFKTEVCSNSGCRAIAMLWIKEVEMAKSLEIEGRDSTDSVMLHATIAFALKRVISHQHFRRRVSVDEQTAKPQERIPCAPKLERTQDETSQQERCVLEKHGLGKKSLEAQKEGQGYALLSCFRSKGNGGAHFKISRGTSIRG